MSQDEEKEFRQKVVGAVVTVGDGRGFVVDGPSFRRLVVTAAHCLPFFPPCHGASDLGERTYKTLLAPLGGSPAVWAECLFADPIADVAVLGSPDNQELWNEADAYEALVKSATPISIADAPEKGNGWLLSLDQRVFRCSVEHINTGRLWISDTTESIAGGMSGSPIISDGGAAIGVVSLAAFGEGGGPLWVQNPRLVNDLPGWLLRAHSFL